VLHGDAEIWSDRYREKEGHDYWRDLRCLRATPWRGAGAALEAIMIWGHIQANWKRFQPQIRHRWDKLTDEDVARIKGHRGVLIDCLQQRYGYGREEAQQEVRRWEHQF
jgi:uncharacterized protein YjbJ (UPF0337 family)